MSNKIAQICVVIVLAVALTGTTTYIATTSVQNSSNDAEMDYYDRVMDCVNQIKGMTSFEPDIAIVLGTGCQDFIEEMDIVKTIPYSEIKNFPTCTSPTHIGNLVFGTIEGVNIVVMQGRFHYYEGYDMLTVTLPIRVIKMLGVNTIILTNAVGSLNSSYRPGSFCVVTDHISDFIPSPLIGTNYTQFGPRFPAMDEVYDSVINDIVKDVALNRPSTEHKITVNEAVFVQTTGPQYETPAECEMFRLLGADTVGMSSACESIVAEHMGMRVCDINCVTNVAGEDITTEEVEEMMKFMTGDLNYLLRGTIKQLGQIDA